SLTVALPLSPPHLRLDHEAKPEGVPVERVQPVAVEQPHGRMRELSRRGILALHDVQDRRCDVQTLSREPVRHRVDEDVAGACTGVVQPGLECVPVTASTGLTIIYVQRDLFEYLPL